MFDYFINKWIIARQFQETDSGYLYRRRPDLPGIVLTEDERRETMREYRRRYWRSWLLFLGSMLAATFAFAVMAIALGLDEASMTIVGYVLVGVMLVFILREQREWSLIPERRFADRPPRCV